jgi:hypothetical protein
MVEPVSSDVRRLLVTAGAKENGSFAAAMR